MPGHFLRSSTDRKQRLKDEQSFLAHVNKKHEVEISIPPSGGVHRRTLNMLSFRGLRLRQYFQFLTSVFLVSKEIFEND
jgi:hypothetical protein